MKGKRQGIEIKDMSGGQVTNAKLVDIDTKYTPDCLNVYWEGALRKRLGIATLNSSAVTGSPSGNGISNWVVSASQQYLMASFAGTLKQMTLSGNSWSGTWNTVSVDSAGTAFSDAIMHFVTYQTTLIMTTEHRDKPQRMLSTDTTYSDLEAGGAGVAPLGKYPQVWKGHTWLLNIGGGGQLTEDCASLSTWTTLDVAAGVTATATFLGLQTFRFHGGAAAGSDAHIKQTVVSMTTAYSAEIKTYFATLGAVTAGDYASMDICNGSIRFRTRWSTDGLEVYNGTAWVKIGVGLVSTGTWSTWKFLVTAGTATAAAVDVLKDNSAVGLQFLAANASTASNGQIDLVGNAGGSANRIDWYMDYLYVNSISPRSNYYTDSGFESWVSASQASYTDTVLPTTPLVHFKMNDSAANSTVANAGSSSNAGASNNSAGTINTSVISVAGKISNAFSLSSASTQHISIHATDVSTISSNTTGTICFWINPTSLNYLFWSGNAGTGTSQMSLYDDGSNIHFTVANGGVNVLDTYLSNSLVSTTDGAYKHIAIVNNGTAGPNIYVNNSLASLTNVTFTTPSAWFATMGTVNKIMINGRQPGTISAGCSAVFDDFRYYTSALTTAEISSIYAEGNGNEGQPATVREGTTFYQGTFAYRINNDGTYAVVNQTLASGTALGGQACLLGIWANVTNNATYKLRINDGVSNFDSATLAGNGTWQYQTLSFTPVSNTTAVRAQMISLSSATAIFDQAAVTLGPPTTSSNDHSDRLQRSAINTFNDWTGTDSGNNDITTPGDIGLTGSAILNDKMYVFKKWSIHRITYTGSTPLLDIKQSKSTVGTASPRSIKNVDIAGAGEVLIFLGTDRRLYIFDGFQSQSISDNMIISNGISSVYFDNINSQALDKVHATYHSDRGWYELFVPLGSSNSPDFSILVDLNQKPFAFWPYSNRNFLSNCVSDNGLGQRVVYVQGNTNGVSYLLNSTTSDAGSAINGYWTSYKVGSPVMLNKIDELEVQTDSVVCSPTFQWRMDWETSWVSKTLNSSSYSHNFNPGRIDNFMQFKMSDNSTTASYKLWSIGAYEKPLGIGK